MKKESDCADLNDQDICENIDEQQRGTPICNIRDFTNQSTLKSLSSQNNMNFKQDESPKVVTPSGRTNINIKKVSISVPQFGQKRTQEQKNSEPSQKGQFSQYYELKEKIGEGGSSVVFKCVRKVDGQQFVAKRIQFDEAQYLFKLIEENRLLGIFNHPHIVKRQNFFIEKSDNQVFIIMQYCLGEPLSYFIDLQIPLQTEQIKIIMKQSLEAIQVIHQKGICHRDISLYNLIYDRPRRLLKIIDFSISKDVKDERIQMWTPTGNLAYVAPECFTQDSDGYGQKIDLWSLGVVMYALVTGNLPFFSDNKKKLMSDIKKKEIKYSEIIDQNLLDDAGVHFLQSLLQRIPSQRISPGQALRHNWLDSKSFNVEYMVQHQKMLASSMVQRNNMQSVDGGIMHHSSMLKSNQELQGTKK